MVFASDATKLPDIYYFPYVLNRSDSWPLITDFRGGESTFSGGLDSDKEK